MGAGVDWHGFELSGAGKGHAVCAGGSLLTGNQHPRYVPLPYGRSWHSGSFTCTSRVAGVTCRSRAGHGFFVSLQTAPLALRHPVTPPRPASPPTSPPTTLTPTPP